MRVKGLEPSRELPHQNLNLARLPISPHPQEYVVGISGHMCTEAEIILNDGRLSSELTWKFFGGYFSADTEAKAGQRARGNRALPREDGVDGAMYGGDEWHGARDAVVGG